MATVGSLEFQRKFGEFQHKAQREPVPDPFEESWQALASRHLCEGSLPNRGA